MNVAKNWALTIRSFFEQTAVERANYYIPVKKTLSNAGHIDAKIESILAKFAKTKSSEIDCFLLIVSWRSFPPKFPVKSTDFSKNLPRKSFEI